jgi:hypothetical protein
MYTSNAINLLELAGEGGHQLTDLTDRANRFALRRRARMTDDRGAPAAGCRLCRPDGSAII